MKASGQSFTTSQAAIEKAGLSLEKFGYTSVDSAQALTVLERGTGNITEAIKLQGLAADLARAKNIGLSDAANVVAKVFGGQETALRRAVPGLEKHAHGLDLIAEAQQRLAGQAAASTTVAERFSATLHDTEIIVGNALLPAINKLLTSLGNWLNKMNESGKLQRDVNSAVKTGTALFQALVPWVNAAKTAFKDLGDVVGGTKNELELLIGAFAAFKGAKVATSIASAISGVRQIGTTAEASTGEVAGLRGALVGLAGPAAIVAGVLVAGKELGDLYNGSGLNKWANQVMGNTEPLDVAKLRTQAAQGGIMGSIARKVLAQMGLPVGTGTGPVGPVGTPFHPGAGLTGPVGITGGANGPAAARRQNYTPEEKLLIALSRSPNNIGLLRQQAAYDQHQVAFLNRLQASGKGPGPAAIASEIEGFNSDRSSRLSTIAGIQSASASKTAAAAAKAKAALAAMNSSVASILGHAGPLGLSPAALRKAFNQEQEKLYGSYSTPHALQLALVREQALGTSQEATLKAARAAARKALRSGKLMWQAQIDAYNEIISVNDQLKNSATAVKDTYRQQRARAVSLAHAQGAGYQFAYADAGPRVHIENFYSTAANPRALEDQLLRRAKARSHVRRGAR